MRVETRWLNWDGFYGFFGNCNQELISTTNRGIRARLKRLGFYSDNLGFSESIDETLEAAIKDFKAFPNLPNSSITGNLDSLTRSKIQSLLKEVTGADSEVDLQHNTEYVELAVKIVEVPISINPFEEFARIKIEMNRFERVESMMLRVYRNFDLKTDSDTAEIPVERLVYQEVLHQEDIRKLPKVKSGDKSTGIYSREASDIIKKKRRHDNSFVRREHAPYKFRVWVSSYADTFDRFADINRIELRHLMSNLLDNFEPFEFKREEQESFNVVSLDPKVQRDKVVYDQPGFIERPFLWTRGDTHGINLMMKPSEKYHQTFLKKNQNQEETFVTEVFLNNPVETYLSLWKRANESPDGNFKYPELLQVFANIDRHIERIRYRLDSGEDSYLIPQIKQEITFYLNELDKEIGNLSTQGFPYRDSILFIAKFINIFDWIIFYTKTWPELEHYQLTGLGEDGFKLDGMRQMKALSQKRNQSEAFKYVTQYHNSYEELKVRLDDIYNGKSGVQWKTSDQIKRILEIKEIIVIPSYNPLDEAFFTKIRQVPMFMLGLIDLEYLNADAHRYSPWEFFTHDMFHTISNSPYTEAVNHSTAQLWHSMLKRVQKITQTSGFGSEDTMRQIFSTWDRNAKKLRELAEKLDDQELLKAFEIVLFCLFHEPVDTRPQMQQVSGKQLPSFPPALVEPESIRHRIDDLDWIIKISERARDNWFGPLSDNVLSNLGIAHNLIQEMIEFLENVQLKQKL